MLKINKNSLTFSATCHILLGELNINWEKMSHYIILLLSTLIQNFQASAC